MIVESTVSHVMHPHDVWDRSRSHRIFVPGWFIVCNVVRDTHVSCFLSMSEISIPNHTEAF